MTQNDYNQRIEKLEKMFSEMNSKVIDIHKALIGDNYGNNGYIDRIQKLEKNQRKYEKIKWMIIGGSAVLSAIVGFLSKLIK